MLPLFILSFINYLFNAYVFDSSFIITLPSLGVLIILLLLLPGIGFLFSVILKRSYFFGVFKTPKYLFFLYVTLSFFVAFFFSRTILYYDNIFFIVLALLFLFFSFYFPCAGYFLSSIDISRLSHFFKLPIKSTQDLFFLALKAFVIILFVLFWFGFTKLIEGSVITFYSNRQLELTKPFIENVEPKLVYYGSYVVVKGKRFGLREGGKLLSSSTQGEIEVTSWTNTKIIFLIPLNWKTGELTFWIKRSVPLKGGELLESNKATIKILPIHNHFTKEDDAYFEQLKHLDRETLLLNGYKDR